MSLIVKTRTSSSADQLALAGVERADADERRPLDRRRRPRVALEARRPPTPSAAASGIPCTLPRRRGLGPVQVAVRVDPEHAAGAVRLRHPAERADRDRVVAAEDERHVAACARLARRAPRPAPHDALIESR